MQKITFQDTEVVKAPYVEINGVEYEVESEYQGGTDLNAETFNQMQDNIEDAIDNIPIPIVPDIVDNLSTDDSTKTLSAKQGKVLNDKTSGTILYEDISGSNQDITLNDEASNYCCFEIWFHNNDNIYAISRVPYTTNNVYIATLGATGSDIVVKTATLGFSGKTIQRIYTRERGLNGGGNTTSANYIYIDKVIGYN